MTKLIKAFGIYFIVWACLTFIYSFASLINNFLVVSGKLSLSYFLGSSTVSFLDWSGTIVGFIGAFILFFTGIFVLKLKESSLKWVIFSGLVFILKDLINIGGDIQTILKNSSGYFGIYGTAFQISLHSFSVLFWIFTMFFFNKNPVNVNFRT